jgi:hypothetical protein
MAHALFLSYRLENSIPALDALQPVITVGYSGKRPSGAKARIHFAAVMARLKPCPFKTGVSPQSDWLKDGGEVG